VSKANNTGHRSLRKGGNLPAAAPGRKNPFSSGAVVMAVAIREDGAGGTCRLMGESTDLPHAQKRGGPPSSGSSRKRLEKTEFGALGKSIKGAPHPPDPWKWGRGSFYEKANLWRPRKGKHDGVLRPSARISKEKKRRSEVHSARRKENAADTRKWGGEGLTSRCVAGDRDADFERRQITAFKAK